MGEARGAKIWSSRWVYGSIIYRRTHMKGGVVCRVEAELHVVDICVWRACTRAVRVATSKLGHIILVSDIAAW